MQIYTLACVVLLAMISITTAIPYPKMRGSSAKIWRQYQKLFHKKYAVKEMSKRKRTIISKIKRIKAHNALYERKKTTYYKALTSISDMTNAEYRRTTGFLAKKLSREEHEKIKKAAQGGSRRRTKRGIPAKVDLRDTGCITPVLDQGYCGACYAFTGIAVLEYYYCKWKCGQKAFSVQEIVECSWHLGNLGCYAGNYDWVFQYINETGGIAKAADYPYIEDDWFECKTNIARTPIDPIIYTNLPTDEVAMMEHVAQYRPLAVGIDTPESFQDYGGGIYDVPDCNMQPNHAVTIVGYGTTDDGIDYWLIKNSNGQGWGEGGYMRMRRGVGMCGIQLYPTGLTFTSGQDGYNCQTKSPCTAENRLLNKYYFPHYTKCKFVQCSAYGGCWEMPCGPGTEWNQAIPGCGHKT